MGRPVIRAAAGGTGGSVVDVFFLDRASGAVFDVTFGQPHLTLTTPQPSFYSMVIDDVNGDGIPDLVLGHGTGVAWVYLGQVGDRGALTFSAAIVLTPPAQ